VPRFLTSSAAFVLAAVAAHADTGWNVFAPCAGDCATAIYAGEYVNDSMVDVLVPPIAPNRWDFEAGDQLVATAFSRTAWTFGGQLTIEPEIGLGQRFRRQDETEVWGAVFLRYRGFPWDRLLLTSVAVSTGLNYATAISDVERERSRDGDGSKVMHFFSPELTFAMPQAPNTELLFRFHHRSGVFGLVSEAGGGAQYGTVGLRVRF
jgi:hypothetical protein